MSMDGCKVYGEDIQRYVRTISEGRLLGRGEVGGEPIGEVNREGETMSS